jgi:hypothetical protein
MDTATETQDTLDTKGALRSVNASMKSLLSSAAKAMTAGDWEAAADCYTEISSLASSCRASAERNATRTATTAQ